MDVLKQLLGRLHPLIVHLPIGFIILGLIVQWYDQRRRREYGALIALIYLWAGISAILACVTGYLQYLGEGYAYDTVQWHLWGGIATALFSFLMYAKLKESKAFDFLVKIPIVVLSITFFLLISFTGHQGGSITHGEDYLVEPLPNVVKSALGFETFEEREIVLNEENWEEALIYEDVVKPILNNKCISCHNPKKAKGELLLHSEEGLLKGGENGEVLSADHAKESELYVRMNLPKSDEDHMPPKDKTQPTKEEIQLIGAWIDAGHPFQGTIKDVGLKKELFLSFFPKKQDNDYPDIEIAEVSPDSILSLKKQGIHIENISRTTNFLTVSCINKPSFTDADFELLRPISQQIAVLDLGDTQVTDAIIEKLVTLPHLTILKLDNTRITGNGLVRLAILQNLKSINLAGSQFKESYLQTFNDFEKLNTVYLYNSGLGTKGTKSLKNGQITIDYGNYELPPIPSDTIVY